MSMKRWHHKSRSGCIQCRQRRIKCDEGRPACRNCTRAETADNCTYRQNNNGNPSNSSPASTPATAVASRLPSSTTPGAPVQFGISELELMHHFCISTSSAVDENEVVAGWMRNVAPSLLISHPTLIGGLLGLTAAHIAYLRPYDKAKYTALAYQHLNHALTQSQQALKRLDSSLDAEKAGALCLTAIFTSITIQALPVVDSSQQHMTPLQRFITNFRAYRGISVVFWACSIHGKGFDQNYLPPNGGDGINLSDDESFQILDDIFLVIRKHAECNCHDPNEMKKQAMYCAIFDELRNYVRAKTIRQISTVITGSTPAQWNMFCRLLDEGDVICSLIALCYNVAYANFDHKWFMGGLQHQVAQTLASRVQHLGEVEARIAEWARRRSSPYDAVADCAAQVRSATSTTNPPILASTQTPTAANFSNELVRSDSRFTSETSSISDGLSTTRSGPYNLTSSDPRMMEGLEAGMRLCASSSSADGLSRNCFEQPM